MVQKTEDTPFCDLLIFVRPLFSYVEVPVLKKNTQSVLHVSADRAQLGQEILQLRIDRPTQPALTSQDALRHLQMLRPRIPHRNKSLRILINLLVARNDPTDSIELVLVPSLSCFQNQPTAERKLNGPICPVLHVLQCQIQYNERGLPTRDHYNTINTIRQERNQIDQY